MSSVAVSDRQGLYSFPNLPVGRYDLTISAACKSQLFDFFNRQRLQNWQHGFYAELESVRDLLLPAAPKPPKSKKETQVTDPLL